MNWLEIQIDTSTGMVDDLCAGLEGLGVDGLVIDDEADLLDFMENDSKYWDYIDEDLIAAKKGVCCVKFYLEDSGAGEENLRHLQSALPQYEFICRRVKDEDWENNWKEYYKPIEVGEKLLIVPKWEKEEPKDGRKILWLDPGLIFGTGAHATTQMCLKSLEKYAGPGKNVLDLGCGSGILGIAALVLGCSCVKGCDIDEKAQDVVKENLEYNGLTARDFQVRSGDILRDPSLNRWLAGRYDIILANIVADVIIDLCPRVRDLLCPGGVFICSGIIEGRQDEVSQALRDAGFKVTESLKQDGWHCYNAVIQ